MIDLEGIPDNTAIYALVRPESSSSHSINPADESHEL